MLQFEKKNRSYNFHVTVCVFHLFMKALYPPASIHPYTEFITELRQPPEHVLEGKFQTDGLDQGFSTGVPRDVARGSARGSDWKKNRFLNLLVKINRSTEKKYHSLLKTALTIIIGLLYLQLTDHANVPWAVDIFFMQGFPETWKLFQGFLQGKKIEKGWSRRKKNYTEMNLKKSPITRNET
jgi:hypothetical protein